MVYRVTLQLSCAPISEQRLTSTAGVIKIDGKCERTYLQTDGQTFERIDVQTILITVNKSRCGHKSVFKLDA